MRLFTKRRNSTRSSGFTLLEVLISLAILLVILVAVIQFMADIDQAWKSAAADPFAEAQNAFETVAQNLAAAPVAGTPLGPYKFRIVSSRRFTP
jgi:uncharacterized protein (TIGR02599 family)